MRVALFATPSKPVKRHNGRFYCLTRNAAVVFARLCPSGRIVGTQIFRAAGVFAFYLHTLFGLPSQSHFTYTNISGCRNRRILSTHTFRVAGVLHFIYTNCGDDVDENGYFA